eukprot:COSAG02_NODE_2474_length_8740_cov_6.957991_2_plen_580_part_00
MSALHRTKLKSPSAKFSRERLDREPQSATVAGDAAADAERAKPLDVTKLLDAFRESLLPEEHQAESAAPPARTKVVQPTITTRPAKPDGLEEVSLAAIDVQKMLSELDLHNELLPGKEETAEAAQVPALTALEKTTAALEQNMQRLEAQVVAPQLLDAACQATRDEASRQSAATRIQAFARGAAARRTVAKATATRKVSQPEEQGTSRLPVQVEQPPDLVRRYDALESRVLALAKQQITFQQEAVAMHAVLADQVDTLRSQLLQVLSTVPAVVAAGASPPPQVSGQGLPLYSAPNVSVTADVESTEQFLRAEQEAREQAADAAVAQENKTAALSRERAEQQALREQREEEALRAAQREERDALQAQLEQLREQQHQQPPPPTVRVVDAEGTQSHLDAEVYRTPPRAVREAPRPTSDSSRSSGGHEHRQQHESPTAQQAAHVADLASEILLDRATPPVSPVVMTPSPPKESNSHDSPKQDHSPALMKRKEISMSNVKVIDVIGGQAQQQLLSNIDCPVPRMDTPSPSQATASKPAGGNGLVMTTPTRVRSFAKGGHGSSDDGGPQLSTGKFMAAIEAAAQ